MTHIKALTNALFIDAKTHICVCVCVCVCVRVCCVLCLCLCDVSVCVLFVFTWGTQTHSQESSAHTGSEQATCHANESMSKSYLLKSVAISQK